MSSLPAGQQGVYPDAARLDDLVAAVASARAGRPPLRMVRVDVSHYDDEGGAGLADGWDPADVGGGFVAPIMPVMLDGGRADPGARTSPRSTTPARDATPGARPAPRRRQPTARRRGRHGRSGRSRPRLDRLADDGRSRRRRPVDLRQRAGRGARPGGGARHRGADHLRRCGPQCAPGRVGRRARHWWRRAGPTRAGCRSTTGSRPDCCPPSCRRSPSRTRRARSLRPILDGLPVAGVSGNLEDRFAVGTPAAVGRGHIRAKSGTLSGVDALALIGVRTCEPRKIARPAPERGEPSGPWMNQ